MRQCILVIEDNKDICEAVRYNLEKGKNFSVVEAHTGEEGVNLAFKLKPSLIILDLMLPGVSGFEVCRILRRDPETRHIPILILSAHPEGIRPVEGFDPECRKGPDARENPQRRLGIQLLRGRPNGGRPHSTDSQEAGAELQGLYRNRHGRRLPLPPSRSAGSRFPLLNRASP